MQRFCKKTDINIVLTPFKMGSLFSSKDKLPDALRSFVAYKFTCPVTLAKQDVT